MQTTFKSQELWDIVECGYEEPKESPVEPSQKLRESRKKDAKALSFIQSAVDEDIFPRISGAKTSKEAWEIIKHKYFSDNKVIAVKLQSLSYEFETLKMKEKESMQGYLSKVSAIVNQMKSYGDVISSQTVVSKVLRSLNPNFNHVIAAIEESKDLSTYTFDELMCSLLSHEVRISKSVDEEVEEKAFQAQGYEWDNEIGRGSGNRGRGRGFHGRGYGRGGRVQGRGRQESGGHGQFEEQRSSMSSIQCYYCKRYGHKEDWCWDKQRDEQKKEQTNFAQKVEEEESRLF